MWTATRSDFGSEHDHARAGAAVDRVAARVRGRLAHWHPGAHRLAHRRGDHQGTRDVTLRFTEEEFAALLARRSGRPATPPPVAGRKREDQFAAQLDALA